MDKQLTDPTLAQALRQWRAAHGWSQPMAGRQLGVPLRTYSAWECGALPDHVRVVLLAIAALPPPAP